MQKNGQNYGLSINQDKDVCKNIKTYRLRATAWRKLMSRGHHAVTLFLPGDLQEDRTQGNTHPHPSPDSTSQAADVESGAAPRNIGFPTSRGHQDENTSPWNYQQLATNVATSDLTNASRPPPRQTRDVMKAKAENFHGGGNITFFVRPEYRRSAVVISDEPKAKPC